MLCKIACRDCVRTLGSVWGKKRNSSACFSRKTPDWQERHSCCENSDRLNVYRTFSTVHDTTTNPRINIDRHFKCIMTRYRLGLSDTAEHHYRYKRHTDNDLICPVNGEAQENELRFVLCCPVVGGRRMPFVRPKLHKCPSLFRLSRLLASTSENTTRTVSQSL